MVTSKDHTSYCSSSRIMFHRRGSMNCLSFQNTWVQPRFFHDVLVALALVSWVMFCRSYFLSFVSFFICPLCCHGSSWSWSYGSWMHSYLCNQCLSPLKVVSSNLVRGEMYRSVAFSGYSGFLYDRYDIAEILLKVALNTLNQPTKLTIVFSVLRFTAFGYSFGILSFCWITIHLKKNVYNNSIKVNIWNATIRKHLNTMIIISHDSITWFTIQLHVIQTKTTYFGHQIWKMKTKQRSKVNVVVQFDRVENILLWQKKKTRIHK